MAITGSLGLMLRSFLRFGFGERWEISKDRNCFI